LRVAWRQNRVGPGLRGGVRQSDDLVGLPELVVEGLGEDDARARLLDSVLTGPLDAWVREQIVAETRGNPLALVELPRGIDAGGAGGRVRTPRQSGR